MTAMDDALNEASVLWGPHRVDVVWRELPFAEDSPESISDLSNKTDGITVTQSLHDGLPDPVTMSTSSDMSGVLKAGLTGSPGVEFSFAGMRTFDTTMNGSGWNTNTADSTIASNNPSGSGFGDYMIAAVLIDDSTTTLTTDITDPKEAWDFLGTVSDGTLSLYVYGKRRFYIGRTALKLIASKPATYIISTISVWANNPQGIPLDYRVTDMSFIAETAVSAVTSHSNTSKVPGRGRLLTFWGAASSTGVWSPGTGMATIGQPVANGLSMYIAQNTGGAILDSGIYTPVATSAVATNVGVFASLVLEPYERPKMTPVQYWSPFNVNSPVYRFDRDTAAITVSPRIITATGPVDTPVFVGQMQDIPIDTSGSVSMVGVSKTRIRMNRTVTLPVVAAFREGLRLEWFASWLASRASQFVGPGPNRYTRYWAPLYGSVHAHLDSASAYNAAYTVTAASPHATQGYKFPTFVGGPFLMGMFAQQTATRTDYFVLNPRRVWEITDSPFPHVVEAGGPINADLFSQQNGKGRLNFWIRADPAVSAPSYLDVGDDFLFKFNHSVSDKFGAIVGYVSVTILSSTRVVQVQMGSDAGGYSTVSYAASGALPTDGSWRFIGVYWDFAAGSVRVVHNATESVSTAWATAGNNAVGQLASTDSQGRYRGDTYTSVAYVHLPLAEFLLNIGETYASGIWNDCYPVGSLTKPGETMTMIYTGTGMSAIANADAVNVWDTLFELAKSTYAAMRINEQDNLEFLALNYFGQPNQVASQRTYSTSSNSADLNVSIDPSKSRNVITTQFNEVSLDTVLRPILQLSTTYSIPAGTTITTFPLDVPAFELHGFSNTAGSTYQIYNLTAAQITTPTIPSGQHYITVATSSDGTGSVLTSLQVAASIVSSDASSVTIKFVNKTGSTAYLANSGTDVPFLNILGYGVHTNDGYLTVRDQGSVLVRGERGLDSEHPWIQDRNAMRTIAMAMLNTLSSPRAEIDVRIFADPRLEPGQLITVIDPDSTNVLGLWRILALSHVIDGPSYVQDIAAVQVFNTGVWDGPDGWDLVSWG
jgi:hypothetical protein